MNGHKRVGFGVVATMLVLASLDVRAQEEDLEPTQDVAGPAVAQPGMAIELGAPFRDGAILQREMQVPVWGWSKPGTKVTVEFAGQTKTAAADKNGKWLVVLDPMQASFEPTELVISEDTGRTVTLKDVLVGEVWFASGQSNMQWTAAPKSDVGQVLQKQIAARVAEGMERQPVIREAKITDCYAALHPIEHANAAWNSEGGSMSAIAYAFAYELARELGVPVGILNCSFSETSIQAWTPRVGFRDGTDEYTKAIYQKVLETDPGTPEHKAAWDTYYAEVESATAAGTAVSAGLPGNLHGNRDATWMFNARLNPMIPYAVRGGIWNQGYANMGEGLAYYHNLHSLVRGWRLMWGKPDMPVYFNQFYATGQQDVPSIGGTAEMRLGTWLARDIPHSGMASQIDITGAIHYFNKALAGQRLALQALKNDYGKNVVADGPMYKSYKVEGDRVIVEFEHAEGGLVVAETGSNVKEGLGKPRLVPDGAAQVKLFYVAGEDRVWCPAAVRIEGERVVVVSPKVRAPRGVSYATGGAGNKPNLYNQAMLPMTPFIVYDHELVKSETWPDTPIRIDGVAIDPSTVGTRYEYRKMPLLSTQFRHNAVLQAGQPVTIFGSAVHDWGYEAKGTAEIGFSFAGIEKTIPVTPGMREWQVTLPPMEASAAPKTLKVSFSIDGELVHERMATNVVVGDVWYVAAPSLGFDLPEIASSGGIVRSMARRSKGSTSANPRRFTVAVSSTPENRFACYWEDAKGDLAAALGHRIAATTGKPVGVVFMQSEGGKSPVHPELKSWIPAEALDGAPSLLEDFKDLASIRPGNEYYAANVKRYIAEWRAYWSDYVPEMIATRRVPDGVPWGRIPSLSSKVTSTAGHTYNALVHSFTPGAFRGVLFVAGPAMFAKDGGANYGEQLTVLANSWRARFGGAPHFFYTLPDAKLAPKLVKPTGIEGASIAVQLDGADAVDVGRLVERVVGAAYPDGRFKGF